MDFRDLQGTSIVSAILLLASVVGALASISTTGRKFWRWLWDTAQKLRVFKKMRVQQEMITQLQLDLENHKTGLTETLDKLAHLIETQSKKLDTLVAEVQVNGGSSLRDVLNHLFLENIAEAASRRAMFTDAIAFFEADADGKFVFVSDKLAEILDLNPHEAEGDGWITAIHPSDVERVTKSWRYAVTQKRAFVETFKFWNRKSPEKKVQIHCHPVSTVRKQVSKYIGIVTIK